MGRFTAPADVSIKSESDAECSDENERVPLKQRLKLRLASKQRLALTGIEVAAISGPESDAVVRSCSNQCYSKEDKIGVFGAQQIGTVNNGEMKECVSKAEGDKSMDRSQLTADNVMLGKVIDATSLHQLPSDLPLETKVSDAGSLKKCVNHSSGVDIETGTKIKNENPDDFLDDLDFMVLRERQRMLLSRKALSSEWKNVEGTSPSLSRLAGGYLIKRCTGVEKGDDSSNNMDLPMDGDHSKTSDLSNSTVNQVSNSCQREYLSNLVTTEGIQGNDQLCSTKMTLPNQESSHGLDVSSGSCKAGHTPMIVNVKVEPLESIELENARKHAICNLPGNYLLPMKREQVPENCEDYLDHMLLRDRMKLFSKEASSLGGDGISASLGKIVPSVVDSRPFASAAAELPKVKHLRKRRKTATDSVKEAMEEDAPGLLKVLLEQGVSVDDIKLYGEPESNELADDLSTEDSFTELEEIISKLFSQRHSLLKLGPLHFSKREKPSYCLACLFSLVEQARYLRLRKWPVEWGWCRDLQSFIFVFERHNRIVLEHPEYGYATYFFELVESLPIHWQIKRLITAMKLTSCSRISLIENRALLVGEDLSEGEARVLMEFGWIPNTGLGTMLNYCDRVVHDRKNEINSSEWRSKIGKILVDGYKGGKIVPTTIPTKLGQFDDVPEDTKVKLELD